MSRYRNISLAEDKPQIAEESAEESADQAAEAAAEA